MKLRLSVAWLVVCVFVATAAPAQEEGAAYTYYYKGKAVSLHASPKLIAADQKDPDFAAVAGRHQLVKDPLSARAEAKRHGLAIYRAAGPNGAGKRALSAAAISASTSATIQPVFEQGGAVLIPSDEVLIGFKGETSLSQAQSRLSSVAAPLGITGLRAHRGNIFIATISNPGNGRAFEVAQGVAAVDTVAFAEPNLVVVRRGEQGAQELFYNKTLSGRELVIGERGEGAAALAAAPLAPSWTVLASLDAESATLPPGWRSAYQTGTPAAYWGSTSYRHHGGARSLYCAASGTQAVPAPGPAPANMTSGLLSPHLDLSGYQEVYLELWFYAKNDVDTSGDYPLFNDYAAVVVVDDSTGSVAGELLGIAYDGDCTKDPTTSNGWRRLLFRVPPSFLSSNAHFELQFISDASNRTEGVYVDDLRIVATGELDTAPLSNDRYSGRQYELRNVGQVAGILNGRSDLHLPEAWDLVTVSPDLVVAVIDEGVEPKHPDLNLVTGYDPDGRVGGQPRSEDGEPRGPHGTNCAGNLGAIKDNGIGVVGTAPGVKIMPVYMGTTLAELARAIDVAVQHGARILSNSWGWTGSPSADVEDAVKSALAAGRVVLFAAGNGPDRPPYSYEVSFPGILTETTDVICVGASSPSDEHKSASSSDGEFYWGSSYLGAGPDLVAPGSWSYTTDLIGADGDNDGSLLSARDLDGASYNPDFGGTSSSTPKVAGVAALMLSKNPDLTPAQVKSILMSSADDIDLPGTDDKTGAGRVNAYRAVLAVPAGSSATSLTVMAMVPANGATSVPPGSAISAIFNQAMDGSTINSSTFTVDNGVTGTVTYNSASATATFTPSRPLSGGVTYTATVGTGARSAAGAPLSVSRSWSFTTAGAAQDGNLVVNGGFEAGTVGWTVSGAATIVNRAGFGHGDSDGYLLAGNASSVSAAVFQDISIPDSAWQPLLSFWYKVSTTERSSTSAYDTLAVQLKDPSSGAVLQTLKLLSNLDAAGLWLESEQYDLSRYAGQKVRLEFDLGTDGTLITSFQIDDVLLALPTDPQAQTQRPVYLYHGEDGAVAMSVATGGVEIAKAPELGRVVAQGDFNGDGVADLAWWNGVTGELHLQLMSDPQTVQGVALLHREPDTSWRVVAAGDVDGDGKSDLIWHNALTGTVYLMLVDGAAQRGGAVLLTEPDTAWKIVAAADLDADGKSDLIWWHAITGQVAVTLMGGSAPYTRRVIYQEPDTNWRIVGAADLNGDRKADLVWKNRLSGQVYAMLLAGTTATGGALIYTEPDPDWEIVSVGSFNSSGEVDLLWRNAADGRIYLMPLAGLSVAPGFQLPAPADTTWQVLGQQQGQDESYGPGLTTAHGDAGCLDWYNTLSGALYGMTIGRGMVTGGAQLYREADTAWQIAGHGDFNGDGVTDSVWHNSKTGQVFLQYMNSSTEVKGGYLLYQEPDTAWRIVATGDLDGDRKTDLIWWNSQTGQVYGMLLGNQGIAGGSPLSSAADTDWKVVAVADLDGNGKADLIWWHTASGRVAISRINGAAPSDPEVIYTEPDTNWRIVGAGDLDGDGKGDLIWHNRNSGQVYAMLLNGATVAGGALIHTEPDTNWEIVSVGNYNNDGKADLLWWNRSTGSVYLMPLDGLRAAPGYALYREPDTNWRIEGETEWKDRAYGVGVTTTSR